MANPQQSPERISRDKRLWRLGTTQLVITLLLILAINFLARRLHLGFGGSIFLCALVAFGWPFLGAWWNRRKR